MRHLMMKGCVTNSIWAVNEHEEELTNQFQRAIGLTDAILMALAKTIKLVKPQKEVDSADKLLLARQSFIEGAGSIAVSLLGILNRVCGQIFALLFLSRKPLSLDDIVEELGVSKGNVSVNIRILEDYKLVKKVWIKGSRRDYYEALDELPKKIIKEFFDKIKRNIEDSLDMVQDCFDLATLAKQKGGGANEDHQADFMLQRLNTIRSFYQNAHFLFEALYSGQKVDTSLLRPIINGS